MDVRWLGCRRLIALHIGVPCRKSLSLRTDIALTPPTCVCSGSGEKINKMPFFSMMYIHGRYCRRSAGHQPWAQTRASLRSALIFVALSAGEELWLNLPSQYEHLWQFDTRRRSSADGRSSAPAGHRQRWSMRAANLAPSVFSPNADGRHAPKSSVQIFGKNSGHPAFDRCHKPLAVSFDGARFGRTGLDGNGLS